MGGKLYGKVVVLMAEDNCAVTIKFFSHSCYYYIQQPNIFTTSDFICETQISKSNESYHTMTKCMKCIHTKQKHSIKYDILITYLYRKVR